MAVVVVVRRSRDGDHPRHAVAHVLEDDLDHVRDRRADDLGFGRTAEHELGVAQERAIGSLNGVGDVAPDRDARSLRLVHIDGIGMDVEAGIHADVVDVGVPRDCRVELCGRGSGGSRRLRCKASVAVVVFDRQRKGGWIGAGDVVLADVQREAVRAGGFDDDLVGAAFKVAGAALGKRVDCDRDLVAAVLLVDSDVVRQPILVPRLHDVRDHRGEGVRRPGGVHAFSRPPLGERRRDEG